MARLKTPPVDAPAVAAIAATLPDNYMLIEDFSLDYVDYRSAWSVYGLPWYFPTVNEVLRDHAGDCQARALLAASIFEAKGTPYTLRYSFDHVWVDYPGKFPPAIEDPATSFVADSGKGWLAKLPSRIPLWSIIKVRVGYHWTPMPLLQKIMTLLGTVLIIGWGRSRGCNGCPRGRGGRCGRRRSPDGRREPGLRRCAPRRGPGRGRVGLSQHLLEHAQEVLVADLFYLARRQPAVSQ